MTSTVALLIADNLSVLRQGRELVRELDGPAFTASAPALALSGVGPHLRHVLDVYERFLEAVEMPETGVALRIDYDARDRDPRLETDPARATAALSRTMDRLRAVSSTRLDRPLEARSDGSPWIPTTVARELQSLVSHTVHHFALIAVAVRCQGGEPGPDFGVAPSTLRHRESQRQPEVAGA
ncbi:MAG: DinB family protein [Planctomycetota bacterium]|nr:DinB family protein [Planctomycetota bacterium]